MQITTNDFDYISKLVLDKSAIVLEAGKEYLVESRMVPLLFELKLNSIEDLVKKLRTGASNGLVDKVVEALTTNETSFFRDIHPFNILRDHVLPDVIEKQKNSKELNIWCAASSSGQEPYTIAMIIKSHFPQLSSWKINFISSDISTEMLNRCKRGVYSQLEVNRGLPAPMLIKFFERNGTEWKIKDELINMIDFRQINLAAPLPLLPKTDIVFIRNVLIYFDVATKKNVLEKIRSRMKSGSYLFLGAVETTLNIDQRFRRLDFPKSGCHQFVE